MAEVLSATPLHGLDAVLVAVERALQSGRLSGEHVMNVLGRLGVLDSLVHPLHRLQHPKEMAGKEVEASLSMLAIGDRLHHHPSVIHAWRL